MALDISNLRLTGKKIVIIEDDPPSARYYEMLLKNSGAEIIILRTGKDFVDYLDQETGSIDIVIMDYLIPLVNGIECIRIFRRKRKETPVLMISAYNSEQTRTEAFIAGCNEYILKPIYPEKIFFLLGKYLKVETSVSF